MKIYPITPSNLFNNSKSLKYNTETRQAAEKRVISPLCAYRDYDITFTGRTPEDFYAQDFNRDNMPQTMKDYLYYDYENRQHIPPEQMMAEVFKYIGITDNFDEVKEIYPNEDLFKDLHPNHKKSRKDILSEIETARALSDAPLLKDGNDDFGMYLLRKIYLEGKTIKEISKDFLEKDINDEYKGIITEPVKYATLEAYGISYPKQAFWNSFIHTRDEYKKFFVTLPKNSVIPGVNISTHSTSNSDRKTNNDTPVEEKSRKRRYNIKPHKKREIQREIKQKGGDVESIKKAVVKRFGKDDPEASFIVRYMSPIMTVAADRAHLSEEIKAFAELEQAKGKTGDGRTMFERFWKHNPQMLEVFSAAVTDSIDMFEDIYGEGGLIAINTDLEKITINSEKKKVIDHVNPEFLELLQYTQTIEPERTKRYELHDELQKEWSDHFIKRYGEPYAEKEETPQIEEPQPEELSWEEKLDIEAAKNNAQVFKVKSADGSLVYITSNLDEVLNDQIKRNARFYPSKYAAAYIKSTKAQEFSENFKFTLAVQLAYQKAGIEKTEDYDPTEYDNGKMLSTEDYHKEFYKFVKFHIENIKKEHAARFAIIDTMVKGKDINICEPKMYDMPVYNLNEDMVVGGDKEKQEFRMALRNAKSSIDTKYSYYTTPATNSEQNKIDITIIDMLSKYDPNKSIIEEQNSITLTKMMKESLQKERNREGLKAFLSYIAKDNPYTKSLLLKGIPDEMKQAKFDIIMDDAAHILVASLKLSPNFVTIFDNEIYTKYRTQLSSDVRQEFDRALKQISYDSMVAFYNPDRNLDNRSLFRFKPDLNY